jgi:hypothetical protein
MSLSLLSQAFHILTEQTKQFIALKKAFLLGTEKIIVENERKGKEEVSRTGRIMTNKQTHSDMSDR